MKRYSILLVSLFTLTACGQQNKTEQSETVDIKETFTPEVFMPELTPEGMIIHAGSFSPDLRQYYYTLSDSTYNRFDTFMVEEMTNHWSEPKPAFFNSEFSDHGVKFSPNGQQIYFASTRPTDIEGIPETWHLWRVNKTEDNWSAPEFIDIPNLRDKLVSHPTITIDGTLYFHASNLDYSNMTLYSSKQENGKFGNAQKLSITENSLACTPFVTADGQTLLYANIGQTLDLMMSHKDAAGKWSTPMVLDSILNSNGQGNPYLTPDGKYLFYTSSPQPIKWQVNKVSTKNWLK